MGDNVNTQQIDEIKLDDVPVALLIVQRDYQIVGANRQSYTLFGYDHGQLFGKSLDILIPFDSRDKHRQAAEIYWQNRHPKRLGIGRDLFGLRSDGVLVPIEIGLYPYKDSVMVLAVSIANKVAKKAIDDLKSFLCEIQPSYLKERIEKAITTLE